MTATTSIVLLADLVERTNFSVEVFFIGCSWISKVNKEELCQDLFAAEKNLFINAFASDAGDSQKLWAHEFLRKHIAYKVDVKFFFTLFISHLEQVNHGFLRIYRPKISMVE
jgi:hypothetical protein